MSSHAPTESENYLEVRFSPLAWRGAILGYFLMGVSASMLGPQLDTLAAKFHVSLATAGILFSTFAIGGLLGNIVAWRGLNTHHGRQIIRLGLSEMIVGSAGTALAPSWAVLLIAIAVLGMGFAALNISLNSLMTRTALDVRSRRLNTGNATFGAGAVAGPLLVVALGAHHYALEYLLIIPLALTAISLLGGFHAQPLKSSAIVARSDAEARHRRPILITFVVGFICYLLVESSTSGWLATDIHHIGHSTGFAAAITAGFWGGLGIGRYLAVHVHRRLHARQIMIGGVALAMVVAPLAVVSSLAPFIFPLLGFLIAATFPMGLLWYSELVPNDGNGVSMIILFVLVGNLLGPWTVGRLVSRYGIHAVPLTISAFGLLTVLVLVSALRFRPFAPTA